MSNCKSNCLFKEISSFENIFQSYRLSRKSKRFRQYVLAFDFDLERNLAGLNKELLVGQYEHGKYRTFTIHDPKKRKIQAAPFKDRIIHRCLYSKINPLFEGRFIKDSYACRSGFGPQKAIKRVEYFWQRCSRGGDHREVYALKCDVLKYFASIDHPILKNIVFRTVSCLETRGLINEIIDSGCSGNKRKTGLPIGNLTSQLFANIYLNELDWFIKDNLGEPFYIRYMDDFVVLSKDKKHLALVKKEIQAFLKKELQLFLHPRKSQVYKLNQGLDFLGYRLFLYKRKLRTSSYKRMKKKRRGYVRNVVFDKREIDSYIRSLYSWYGRIKFLET